MLSILALTARRELLLALRRPAEILMPPLFFLVSATLYPLAIGPDQELLRAIAPGVLWVSALLAALLGLQRLFAADFADGTLEQALLAPHPLLLTVWAKAGAHWLLAGLPLVAVAPLLAIQYDMAPQALGVLLASLLLGTPVLSLLGALGAALALNARGGSVLLALMLAPLYIPLLILGSSAVQAEAQGLGSSAHLLLLAGLLCGTAALAPWATVAALRVALE
ncbi:heme exporter protein CcmB [Massilia sp. MB5]|uniref:heme exporter protein CcmB n=1 Tax=Massilia sp. MB5 TaxID=2919578 RepID=UPI001F0F4747|nr:heme exporter protein CcmB [Massilia sp. MB5]UMR29410.1 heme exporter protein CcmB [Massilia sp. MB5]